MVAASAPAAAATKGLVVGNGSRAQLALDSGRLYVQDTKVDGMRAGAEIQVQMPLLAGMRVWTYVEGPRVWDTNGANGGSPSIYVCGKVGKYSPMPIRVVTWTQNGGNGDRKNVYTTPSFNNICTVPLTA